MWLMSFSEEKGSGDEGEEEGGKKKKKKKKGEKEEKPKKTKKAPVSGSYWNAVYFSMRPPPIGTWKN